MGDAPGMDVPDAEKGKVMLVAIKIGNDILMDSDVIASFGGTYQTGNTSHICISPESEEETKRLFAELSEGGKITMPLEKQFWGAWFGTFIDRFGVSWMINFDA